MRQKDQSRARQNDRFATEDASLCQDDPKQADAVVEGDQRPGQDHPEVENDIFRVNSWLGAARAKRNTQCAIVSQFPTPFFAHIGKEQVSVPGGFPCDMEARQPRLALLPPDPRKRHPCQVREPKTDHEIGD